VLGGVLERIEGSIFTPCLLALRFHARTLGYELALYCFHEPGHGLVPELATGTD
jgi:hypothetical protein